MKIDCAAWLDEHGDFLYRYARKHVRDRAHAEDLVQETFLAALQAVSRFEGHSSPRTWLCSILRHKIIDRIRGEARESTMSLRFDEAAEEFFDRRGHWSAENLDGHWSSDPEHGVSQAQFLELLQSCLGKLPSVHQKVFLLREVSELEADEICQLLGLGVSNLRVILHRSRLALQRCISVSAESKERV